MDRFTVKYARFPEIISGTVLGMTEYIPEQGRYLVAIDSARPEEEQRETLKHELAHILLHHSERSIEAELAADRKAAEITDDQLNQILSFADEIQYLTGHFDMKYHYIP